MSSPGWFSLIVLRQFLLASGRMLAIIFKSRPQKGFPILSACLDVMERIAADQHADTVAPALRAFLEAVEDRCPGVTRALFPADGDPRDLHHGGRLGPPPGEAAEG